MKFAKKLTEVKGFEQFEDYAVTKFGDVYSFKAKKPLKLKQATKKGGYKFVLLRANNKTYNYNVHIIVASAFCEKKKNKEVDHLDGNPSNNHFTNLEWVTHKENMIRGRGKYIYKLNLKGQILNCYKTVTKAIQKEKDLKWCTLDQRYTDHVVLDNSVWVYREDLNKHINKTKESNSTEIYAIDKKGNIVGKYKTPYEAERNGGFTHQCIYLILSGKQKTHKGHTFVFVKDYEKEE